MKRSSWKTTLFGSLAAAAGGLASTDAGGPEVQGWAAAFTTIFGALFAAFARDNNVSSKDVNAGQ